MSRLVRSQGRRAEHVTSRFATCYVCYCASSVLRHVLLHAGIMYQTMTRCRVCHEQGRYALKQILAITYWRWNIAGVMSASWHLMRGVLVLVGSHARWGVLRVAISLWGP